MIRSAGLDEGEKATPQKHRAGKQSRDTPFAAVASSQSSGLLDVSAPFGAASINYFPEL
jgi:hypothetical protein